MDMGGCIRTAGRATALLAEPRLEHSGGGGRRLVGAGVGVGWAHATSITSQAPWVQPIMRKGMEGYVTDGPWLQRLPNGALFMLWSSFSVHGYAIGTARSASGQLSGPWLQDVQPLFDSDGGHGMTFRDFDGNLWLSFHQPNQHPNERPQLLLLAEDKLASGDR